MCLKKISFSFFTVFFVFSALLDVFADQLIDQHCKWGDVCWWGSSIGNADCDSIYGKPDSSSIFRLKRVDIVNDSVWFTGYVIRSCSDSLSVCTFVRSDTIFVKIESMGSIYRMFCHYGYRIAATNCTLPNYRVIFSLATNTVIRDTILDTLIDMSTSIESRRISSSVGGGIILKCSPNPFRNSISFEVFGENLGNDRTLSIYDVTGKRIAVLSGTNRFVWERGVYPSGAYIAVLTDRHGKNISSKKFFLL